MFLENKHSGQPSGEVWGQLEGREVWWGNRLTRISALSCLSISSSDASRNGFIPTMVSQGSSQVGSKFLEVYWGIKGVRILQGLAGEGLGHSGYSAYMTPHIPQLWVFRPP